MGVEADTTILHYRVVEQLGAGGMGEVYRARDERLGRDVAIKVLPDEVARDAERLARFEREARLLASLSHQNIATLYGLETLEGTVGEGLTPSRETFLVMELAEGETLAERIERAPIPMDDAIEWARQIADGLKAAHDKGIIHRDLKPANVMVSPEGAIKILDFGLAKAWRPEVTDIDFNESPTLTAQMTAEGVLLGTAAYMSPEQARGQPVDKQADIWAFGCVLYEMLTGRLAFDGVSSTEVLAAVLKEEVDQLAIPADTPRSIRRLLVRCLAKDPRDRLHDIADARLELEDAQRGEVVRERDSTAEPTATLRRFGSLRAIVGVTLVGALLGVAATAWFERASHERQVQLAARLTVDLAEGTTLHLEENSDIAVSPDGRALVWVAVDADGVRRLYLRRLDEFEVRPLEGTEDAYGPFFSPDGRWIAYFDHVEAQLEKTTVEGGFPTRICDAPSASKGGTWGDRGGIVFSPGYDRGLWLVSADGGTAEPLTEPDREAGIKTHRFAHFLPGGRAVVFMVAEADIDTFNESRIEALNVETGQRTLVVEGGMNPRYTSSGHLVFARRGALWAAPFDIETLRITDQPKPVLDGVITNDWWGFAEYAVSSNGLLVYAPGGPEIYHSRFVQADRNGRIEPLGLPEQAYSSNFQFSPDGRRFATGVWGANYDIWLWDFDRRVLARLTKGWNNNVPVWSPDGRRLLFQSDRRAAGASDLLWKPADGSGPASVLVESFRSAWPSSWSPDGRLIGYMERGSETDFDIWIVPVDANTRPGTPRRKIATGARELWPRFSPDGRWLAYTSDESGAEQVYIEPYPGPGPRHQLSSGGGTYPVWGPDGDEVFYLDGARSRMMRAAVRRAPEITIGAPEALFTFDSISWFELSPDGEHFVFLQPGSEAQPITQLRVVTDWFTELEHLVSTD